MRRPVRTCCNILLLCLAMAPGLVSASLPHDSYLFLVDKHRRLAADATARPKSICSGKQPGEAIDGQYIIVFDTAQVSTITDGVSAVRRHLQRQVVRPTAAFPSSSTQPVTPADAFALVNALTTVPEPDVPNTSSSSSSGRRRLLAQRLRRQRSPYLGAVVQVPLGPAGDALVKSINATAAVETIVPDVCVKAMDFQQRFSCLPATMLSSSIYSPSATAAWEGCLNGNTYLAWYGERCGSGFNQVLWTGVYAFDKSTGARLPSCVKQRPASGGTGDAQVAFWLGACGIAPGALSAVPGRVCADPYISDTIVPAEQQGCMSHNFTDAVQTVELFHPTVGCGSGQPVSMTFRGRRCTSNNGTSSSISMAGVLWQTAEPAAGSGLDAAKCALQRRAGAAADDLIFNMDWFGSCGVPPARVQFIPRSECPAAPPPPPPSPSPRPDDQKALDREPMLPGETTPAGIMRTLALTKNGTEGATWETAKVMRPVAAAVMDSGVDCFHRDLNVVYNRSFLNLRDEGSQPSDLQACWDVYDHGTNVAGIIGAKNNGFGVVGVLPNTAIVSLKILNWDGGGPASAIADASLWLLSQSLDGTTANPDNATNAQMLGVNVINMSFGYKASPYNSGGVQMCRIMQQLLDAGIVPVAAAGNEKTAMNDMMPAACSGVVAVTAIDQQDGSINNTQNAAERFTNFLNLDTSPGASNPPTPFKANMTVAAPGERIWSTCYQQNAPYCTRSGTSQATPHVTGMMARCFSGGRCQAAGNGTTSVWYAVNKWMEYNLDHFEYGYSKDPIRQPRGNIFYFGYLTVADVW